MSLFWISEFVPWTQVSYLHMSCSKYWVTLKGRLCFGSVNQQDFNNFLNVLSNWGVLQISPLSLQPLTELGTRKTFERNFYCHHPHSCAPQENVSHESETGIDCITSGAIHGYMKMSRRPKITKFYNHVCCYYIMFWLQIFLYCLQWRFILTVTNMWSNLLRPSQHFRNLTFSKLYSHIVNLALHTPSLSSSIGRQLLLHTAVWYIYGSAQTSLVLHLQGSITS